MPRPAEHGDGAADRAAVEDEARAREQRAEQVVLGLDQFSAIHHSRAPTMPADQRREDELVRPVDRLADLLQVLGGQQPADDEREPEAEAELCRVMPKRWSSGCTPMRVPRTASIAARAPYR